jgi:hypothetical protein
LFQDGNGKALSGVYYITGEIKKYDDIPETPQTHILKCNMRSRPIVVENRNSYLFTSAFNEEDFICDWDGKILKSGNEPELVEYRKKKKKEFDAEYKRK